MLAAVLLLQIPVEPMLPDETAHLRGIKEISFHRYAPSRDLPSLDTVFQQVKLQTKNSWWPKSLRVSDKPGNPILIFAVRKFDWAASQQLSVELTGEGFTKTGVSLGRVTYWNCDFNGPPVSTFHVDVVSEADFLKRSIEALKIFARAYQRANSKTG